MEYVGVVPTLEQVQRAFEQSSRMKSNMRVKRVCLQADQWQVERELGYWSVNDVVSRVLSRYN
jgi:hypothetical protein